MRELSDKDRKLDALAIELYVNRRRSIPYTCEKLRIGQERLYEIIRRHGIQPRGEGGSKPRKIRWSQQVIDQVSRHGVMAVAKALNVSHQALRYRLEHAMAVGQIVVKDGRAVLVASAQSTTTGLVSFGVDTSQSYSPQPPTTTAWQAVAPPAVQTTEKPTQIEEPEPEVYVGRRRVTDADVREMMRCLGEEELDSYARGETPRAVAYERARVWLRERIRAGVTR